MTRQTDITKCRIEFLKQFDYYVRNVIGDDDITDELWLDCVKCFSKCCKVAGVI